MPFIFTQNGQICNGCKPVASRGATLNYIGSKYKLTDYIKSTIHSVAGSDLSQKIFCDLFAGTGIVGHSFKSLVEKIIANDFEYYAYVLNRNYIGNHIDIPGKQQYINELNQLPLTNTGFIYKHYCLGGGTGRMYFTDHNGMKIDTIRQGIERLKGINQISDDLYYFLLASLLESADRVSNTASVYGAYLKSFKKTAQKDLILAPAEFDVSDNTHEVFNEDANALIRKTEGDILYLDPPYNHRQYGANYHLLNTIALYDNFVPSGTTGLRPYQTSKPMLRIGRR